MKIWGSIMRKIQQLVGCEHGSTRTGLKGRMTGTHEHGGYSALEGASSSMEAIPAETWWLWGKRNLHLYSALIIDLEGKCVKKSYRSYKKDSVVERESNIVNTPNCQTANLPLSDCCLRVSVCACESDLGDWDWLRTGHDKKVKMAFSKLCVNRND